MAVQSPPSTPQLRPPPQRAQSALMGPPGRPSVLSPRPMGPGWAGPAAMGVVCRLIGRLTRPCRVCEPEIGGFLPPCAWGPGSAHG